MNERRYTPNHLRRLWIVVLILGIVTLALLWRLIDLSIFNRHFLQNQCAERTIRENILPSYRGMITDRNGEPLAISTPVYAAWIDPKILALSHAQLNQLANLLELSATTILSNINKAKNKQFIYLKRDLSPATAALIKNLSIQGCFLEKQYRRFYPEGEAVAQVVGFTNIDDQGQEGFELAYNDWLQGQAGAEKVIKDRYGNEVTSLGIVKQPIPGHDLTLSIDSRLQYMAYNELAKGAQEFGASSGSVVIIDIHTGEILAMANVPSYNPNTRPSSESSNYRNRALTDLFEPGSSIKPFAMATAISTGKYQPNSMINTSPGYWYVDGKKIDDDEHDNGVINLTKILQVSSNVGMSKIILSIPRSLFLTMLNNLGFGQSTGVGFPGESDGIIDRNANLSSFVLATLSFGYGISVNTLQLAHAYATLANNGIKIPLSFLKVSSQPQGVQVIDSKVAAELRVMLESVLEQGGTAMEAQVPGYRVTGKTGTARILGPHGYEKDHHNSIFVGIAPASNPDLVVAVFLHDPLKGAYYGGFVAGPVFSKIMGESLRILDISPDNS
jgi:cell division protein FtsI (penicillin-binding protein 3)